MQQQEEEKKGSKLNIEAEPQDKCDNALNVLLFGTSGSGKSSLINYLAGKVVAPEGKTGKSETKRNMSYEVTLQNWKLIIFDTQGFNDTESIPNGNIASRIKF